MSRSTIRLLGPFQVQDETGGVLPIASRKLQALLAYLAYPPLRAHARASLADLLWGESGEVHARASLRQALCSLRRCLGPSGGLLQVAGDRIALDASCTDIDVLRWLQWLEGPSPERLAEASACYRGPLLEGFAPQAAAFDEWLDRERAGCAARALRGLEALMSTQLACRQNEAAMQTGLRLLALEPAHEEAHRGLMRLYDALGRRAAALRQYEACAAALRAELGVEPSAETRSLRDHLSHAGAARPDGSASPLLAAEADVLQWIEATAASRCAGRARELDTIDALVDGARRGSGGMLALCGDPGIGKSRLAAEFARRARQAGCCVLLARGREAERALALAPWVEALRGCGPWQHADGDEGPALALHPEPAGAGGAPCFDRLRLFERVVRRLNAATAAAPLAIVFEDLQWADAPSLSLLHFIAVRLVPGRVALLVTRCDGPAPNAPEIAALFDGLARHGGWARIDLAPLGRDDGDRLVEGLLPPGGEARTLADAAWHIGEGNPRLMCDTVAALREGDAASSGDAVLPRRVLGCLGARLDRLSPAAQEMAALAALAGPRADVSLLVDASGRGDDAATSALEELVRCRVLRCDGDRADFTSRALRLAARERLLALRARLLHGRLAAVLEGRLPRLSPEQQRAIGDHYFRARNWPRAVECLHRAGRDAAARSDYRAAVDVLEQALCAERESTGRWDGSSRELDIRVGLGRALVPLGEVGRIGPHLEAAGELAATLVDPAPSAHLLMVRANAAWLGARYDDASAAVDSMARIADLSGDARLRMASHFQRGQIDHFRGDYRQAAAHLQGNALSPEGVAADETCGLPGIALLISQSWRVWSLAELGEFGQAAVLADDLMVRAVAAEHPFTLLDAHRAVGLLHLRRGDVTRGMTLLERGLALARERRLDLWLPSFDAGLCLAHTLAGDATRAVDHGRESVERAEAAGIVAGQALRKAWLASALLRTGDVDGASSVAADGLAGARACHERGHEGWLRHVIGEALISQCRWEEAAEMTGEASRLAGALAMRPLAAACHATRQRILDRSTRSSTVSVWPGEAGVVSRSAC